MNIYELAHRLGVAPGTVSKALNGTGRMKTETRDRIVAAARRHGYLPSAVAANLRLSRTGTIGVIVPAIGMNVFSAIVNRIETFADARDFNLILTTTAGELEREQRTLRQLLRRRVEGIVAIPFGRRCDHDCRHFEDAAAQGVPVVIAEQNIPGTALPKVMTDNTGGARMLTSHLLDLGHRRIRMIVFGRDESDYAGRERADGFRAAFAERGLAFNDDQIAVLGPDTAAELAAGVRDGSVTAVFAVCDHLALRLISELAGLGLRVPADVSVAGFDNIPAAALCLPALTTISQPTELLGQRAAELLFDRIDAPEPVSHAVLEQLPCTLIRRDSCRAVNL